MEDRGIRARNISKLKDSILVAFFSVIIVICSRITIPMVVPFTLQSLGIFLSFSLLGGKRGLFSFLIYLAIGLIGLPVSATGQSGMAMLSGLTGGYLIGWILCGIIVWVFERCFGEERRVKIISLSVGTLVCYTVGTFWFVFVYAQSNGVVGILTALCTCVFPFVIFDALKLLLADRIAVAVKRAVKM